MKWKVSFFMIVILFFTQVVSAEDKWAEREGVKIWTQSFGNAKNPAVLLIMGAGNSADYWPTAFCETVSKKGYYVVRYDHRDTGQSTHVDFKKSPYSLQDLTLDALAVMDAHNIQKAHMVGFSLGGYIAQYVGINHPDRALTLTMISTTANHAPLMAALKGEYLESDLPPPKPVLVAKINQLMRVQPVSLNDRVNKMVDFWRLIDGTGPFNKPFWTHLTREALTREVGVPNQNHIAAQTRDLADRRPLLKNVMIPALVMQGTEDPFFPPPHAQALAEALPNSKLIEVKKMGHVFDLYYEKIYLEGLLSHWQAHS